MKKMIKITTFISAVFLLSVFLAGLTSCYSVFSGGTGGLVVDAESTSVPKAGIANVDVYAYMNASDRDSDFSAWKEGSGFVPGAEYYGHTVTDSDGTFTISKLVWQEEKPDFGKDADYRSVYFLFYQENYGLTKGDSVIISDSVSDTVYVELTAVRKSTTLNLTFEDVASASATNNAVYVKVSVPQTTEANKDAAAKVYDATITGSGSITVSYPRWQSDEKKAAYEETSPEVTISYFQSADEVTWRGCYNADNEEKNYAFRSDEAGVTTIKKTIRNPAYSITLYGKPIKIAVPALSGQYKPSEDSTEADDGLKVSLFAKDASGAYTVNLGETTTAAQSVGNNGTEKHGTFSGLGNGYFWTDTTYTEKYSSADLKVVVYAKDGSELASEERTLRSDASSPTVQLP